MDGLNSITAWISGNETLLSGVAAIVVVLSFVASPLGAGLRGLVRRWAGMVDGPVAVQAAAPPAIDISTPPEPEADRPSVAVMPFVSVTKDEDSEIFADGMTNDIITALGHVPGFFVTSGNSTFVYKGQSIDTRQIGRELGVRYVVEGRIQRAGDVIRINATLVEASSGDQIWSEQFSGDLSDIFALQDEVTTSVVGQLQPELMQAEWRRGSHMPTENLDAWTLLHSARMRYQIGFSRAATEESIRLADAALEIDPDYADAHGFLTWALANRVITRWSDDPERDNESAASHCRTALTLDPKNPIVLIGAAVMNIFTGDPYTAAEQIDQCCAINPNDALAQAVRGWVFACAGRGEEGLEAADLALRLSPRDPRTDLLLCFIAYVPMTLERYDDAEQLILRSLRLNEAGFWAQWVYTLVLAMQGRTTEAGDAVRKLRQLSPDLDLEYFEVMLKNSHGNPTGEGGALIEKWVDSLRQIWPS